MHTKINKCRKRFFNIKAAAYFCGLRSSSRTANHFKPFYSRSDGFVLFHLNGMQVNKSISSYFFLTHTTDRRSTFPWFCDAPELQWGEPVCFAPLLYSSCARPPHKGGLCSANTSGSAVCYVIRLWTSVTHRRWACVCLLIVFITSGRSFTCTPAVWLAALFGVCRQ